MNWLEIQMAIMTAAASATEFAINWIIQSTLLIAIGLFLARLLCRHGSAAQSLIYRTTLVAVLVCPLATWVVSSAGVTGWSVSIQPGYSYELASGAQPGAGPLPVTDILEKDVASYPSSIPSQVAPVSVDIADETQPNVRSGSLPLDSDANQSTARSSVRSTTTVPQGMNPVKETRVPVAELWVFDISWFGLLSPFVLAFWLIVSTFLISRIVASWLRMSRLIGSADEADEATKHLCQALANQLSVASPVVRRSPFISSPCLAGLGWTKSASVLLPADDIDLPIRDVLVHELAHLRRRDCHWNLLRQVSTSVYFFQPLLWVLSRRIEITAEEVCDDIVVQSGGDRENYAHRLVDIAELSSELSSAAVAAAGVGIVSLRSMLARRVERILDTRRSLSTRVGNLLMALVLIGGLAGTVVVGFVGVDQSETVADEQSTEQTSSPPSDNSKERSDDDQRLYSGKVIDTQGNAIADADIFLTCYIPEPTGLFQRNWKPIAKSDRDGKFRFRFGPSDFGDGVTDYEFKYKSLVAAKKGFGFGVENGNKFQDRSGDATIKLAPDHPIRGRLIDINGQPVVGAKLTLFRVYSNEENDLTKWTAEATQPRSDFYKAREHVSTVNSGALVRSVVQPAITNDKGEFVMTNVGKGRVVRLLLEGDGIETQKIRVRTQLGEKIELLRNGRSPELGKWIYYPSQFEHICGPSIPVAGIVRDKKSGRPIAGVTIKSQSLHGEKISGWGSDFIRAVTDENGRYRLTGLPVGSGNRIGAIVSDSEFAYPSLSENADTSVSGGDSDQREVNFDMTRGVWLHGQVADADTGKSVVGTLTYYADKSNPNSDLLRRGVDERDQFRPDEDGNFRIPVFPGKGYLGFLAQSMSGSTYPRATTIIQPDGNEVPAPNMLSTTPHMLISRNASVIAEINPEQDATDYEVNLSLSSGKTITGRVLGPDKKPSSGFHYYGDTRFFSSWKKVAGNEFTLKGIRDGVTRFVYIADAKRNLAGRGEIVGTPSKPIEISVAPAGSVTGRIVDQDGEPLAYRPIVPLSPPVPNADMAAASTSIQPPLFKSSDPQERLATDANGRFAFSCLLPNTQYRLRVKPNDDPGYYMPVDVVIQVQAGETKDLGDVRVSDDPHLFDDAEKMHAGHATHKDGPSQSETVVNAKVVLPSGKSAANTHVAIIGYDRNAGKAMTYAESLTNANGVCELVTTEKVLTFDANVPKTIVARRDGFGIGWQHLNALPDKTIDIQLSQERIIEGKLVDIEGVPAIGEKLLVEFVIQKSEKPISIRTMAAFHGSKNPPNAWPKVATTDDKGWFRLTGIPKDHGVLMSLVDSKNFGPQEISLNTGQSEQRGPRDGTYRPLVKNVKPGEDAVLTLAPAKIITGKITYEDTGKPVANSKISVWASQQKFGSMSSVSVSTDENGEYRILPKPGIRFGVTAYPPSGVPYMARKAEQLDWENSDVTREVNIKLPRVVLVRGRILEEGTDKPVAGAKITFERGEKSSMMPKNVITGWQADQKSDADGKFAFAVPPGRGTLLVRKFGGNYVMKHRLSREVRFGLKGGERIYAHALKMVTTKKDDNEVDVEIHLQPGQSASGRIVDEQGKAVDEAFIISNQKVWDSSGRWRGGSNGVKAGRFELLGLESDKDYPVHFLDPQRKLGATVNLKGGQDDVVVKLEPCGSARAKFILDDPDREFSPTLSFVATPGVGRFDFAKWKLGQAAADADFNANIDRLNYGEPLKSDEDGYYTFSALIPGATYRLFTREAGDWDFKDFRVKSGETLDLGEFMPKFDD